VDTKIASKDNSELDLLKLRIYKENENKIFHLSVLHKIRTNLCVLKLITVAPYKKQNIFHFVMRKAKQG
jgi:hypothetical protein